MKEVIIYQGITWQDLQIATELPFSEVVDAEWHYIKSDSSEGVWNDIQLSDDGEGNCVTSKNVWLDTDFDPPGSLKIQVWAYNAAGEYVKLKPVLIKIKEEGSL